MEPTNTLDRKGDSGATGGPPPTGSGLMQDAQLLWQELRAMAHDQLTLAVLETRLAGKSLVTMIAAAVMVAVLLDSAWLGLMGAAILGLVSIGIIASIALLSLQIWCSC